VVGTEPHEGGHRCARADTQGLSSETRCKEPGTDCTISNQGRWRVL
jgi:hypothetical protein